MTELVVAEAAAAATALPTRLVDGDRVLHLDPEHGYSRASLDIGFPSVRAVSAPRPDADGEDDTTAYYGAAAVTLELLLKPRADRSLTSMLDALRSFCHPRARPYLVVEKDGTQRRIRLRADQGSSPLTAPSHQKVQVAWRAPDGVMESLEEQVAGAAVLTSTVVGRSYPLTYPRTYAVASATGSMVVVNDGTTDVWPLLRLFGPVPRDPRVENQTTGERLIFRDLALAEGEWLEIDCREHTVRLNGAPGQSRLSRLDFAVSTFLRLVPGENVLRYYPRSAGAGARFEARYRPAWL